MEMKDARTWARLRSKLIWTKWLINRTLSWAALLNAAMLIFLVLSTLEKYGVNIRIQSALPLVMLASFIAVFILGWFEWKLGLAATEADHAARQNPWANELVGRLQRIEQQLADLNEKELRK